MKCKQALQRLLATSGKRTLAAEVREHLDGCGSCRQWHDRLAEIDAAVPHLPVPNSIARKSALMARFLSPPALAEPSWGLSRPKMTWQRLVTAAAALVLFGLAITGQFNREKRGQGGQATDALLARVLDRNLELAAAGDVKKRVEVLADLADDLHRETDNLSRVAPADDLNELAGLYESVMAGDRGLVNRADELPEGDRGEALKSLAKRLEDAGGRADREARNVPPAAQAPLRRIAAAAHKASKELTQKVARLGRNTENLVQEAPPRRGEGKS
jgi:hypothetical protein